MTIDELVVTLGLDATKFTQGQREAMDSFRRTQEEARARGKDIEEHGRRIEQSLSRIRNEAIGLFAAAVGASGVKEFVSNIISGDAAVGRLSRTLGFNAADVAKFSQALETYGGDVGEGAQNLGAFQKEFLALQKGEMSPQFIQALSQIQAFTKGRISFDWLNMWKEPLKVIEDISRGLAIIKKEGTAPLTAEQIAAGIPGTTAMLSALLQGGDELKKRMAAIKLPPTNEQISMAEQYIARWNTLSNILKNLGRQGLPFIDEGLKELEGEGPVAKGASDTASAFKRFFQQPSWANAVEFLFGKQPVEDLKRVGRLPEGGDYTFGEGVTPLGFAVPAAPRGIQWLGSPFGAGDAALAQGGRVDNSRSYDNRVEVQVNGPISVSAPSGDPRAITDAFSGGLLSTSILTYMRRQGLVVNSEFGPS